MVADHWREIIYITMYVLALTTARQSERTVEYALQLAKDNRQALHALFVVDEVVMQEAIADLEDNSFLDNASSQMIAGVLAQEYIQRGDDMLKDIQQRATALGVQVTVDLRTGSLFDEIKRLVSVQNNIEHKDQIERIIITRRERSKFSRTMLGSPLDELQAEITVPVDVIED